MDHPVRLESALPAAACPAVRAHLDAYVDDELVADAGVGGAVDGASPPAALSPSQIIDHLVLCPPCRILAQQVRAQKRRLRLLAARLAAQPEERASDALRARVDRLRAG
jgi:predicted anti-sigma-YlaC factor YlaD